MKTTITSRPILTSPIALLAALSLTAPLLPARELPTRKPAAEVANEAKPGAELRTPIVPERSPEDAVSRGLRYLLERQTKGGGWNQGGGWRQAQAKGNGGRVEGDQVDDPADLGNTCVSLMALLKAGLSPREGEHHEAVQRAFEYICAQVEAADADSLWVTDVRDSQMQVKIGTYVDTFLTGWTLSELKGKVADGAPETRRAAALQKVVAKIEKHQKEDGSFGENRGWAAVISQGLASKALNTAARSGAKVSEAALARDNAQNGAGLDVSSGSFSAPVAAAAEPSSAGVSLYREAAKLNGLQEKTRSNFARRADVERLAADQAAPAEKKAEAKKQLQQFDADDAAWKSAQNGVAARTKESRFLAGFGNNGGEEFLSYLNLGEAMKDKGGADWTDWKTKMQSTICGTQNEDGSWAGQHCITGRTFCTGAALMTLLLEPPAARLRLSDASVASQK